jgi:hypothetical protein
MESSSSARKRADGEYEESFTNPQFEPGRKNVAPAELEHVSAQPRYPDQQTTTANPQNIRMDVSEHLQKIGLYLNQINNLISEIQLEKESIKRAFQNLHT